MNGILLINKEEGFSSHDIVSKIRRCTGIRRIGHAGTLDPMAEGLLVICIGKATRMAEYMLEDDKSYIAEIKFGYESDTLDRLGKIDKVDSKEFTLQEIKKVISTFVGEQKQIPPMYSAKRKNGKRLYELAREGIEIDRKGVPIDIYSIDILKYDYPLLKFKTKVSKGTYIRQLAKDIGTSLGTSAILNNLFRNKSGNFRIKDAIKINDLMNMSKDEIENILLTPDMAIKHKDEIHVNKITKKRLCQGQRIAVENNDNSLIRVYSNGIFLGPANIKDNVLKMIKVLY